VSLRPMVFASRVEPILRVATSRDPSCADSVVQSLRAGIGENGRLQAMALLSGEFAGKPETDEYIYVVAEIARALGVQTDEALIANGYWKQSAWQAYFSDIWELLDARGRELVELLATRPVFGGSFESTWPYYGYLMLGEVSELLAKVEDAAKAKPDLAWSDWGRFHGELVGWLRVVEERGTDLWLVAC
jgi:hypothetical protein